MGFFQDLKEDLSQAVTELMDEDNEKKEKIITPADIEEEELIAKKDMTESEEEKVPDQEETSEELLLDGIPEEEIFIEETPAEEMDEVETIDSLSEEEEDELERNLENEIADFLKTQEIQAVEDTDVDEQEYLNAIPIIKNQEKVETDMTEEYKDGEILDETAVITKGMEIKGNIRSRGSMDIIGSIEGDIDILGKLNITGVIKGNSKASEVFADAAKIVGEIRTDGAVKIGSSSVIIGNITATSAVIAGAVKGDIDVRGPVILDTSAIVMGNIKSKSVQINNGAVIEGLCSQCYAEVNPVNFFEDIK